MFSKLKDILIEDMGIDEAAISPEAELMNDLGFNSLELADLVVICEDKFGIEFDEEALPSLITVGDVVSYIENKK